MMPRTRPEPAAVHVLPADLESLAERHLGPSTLVADLSWPYEGSEVYRVRDACGVDHIVKRLINDQFYAREAAGHAWARALGPGRGARLEAADPVLRAVIVTFLPGEPMTGVIPADREIAAYRQAGHLLALLHQAEPPMPDTAVLDRLVGRSEQQLAKAARELTGRQRDLARRAATLLADLAPELRAVPTHGDFQPRNLLLDPASGTVAVIDFEKTALAPPVRDLVRLEGGVFARRAKTRAAFYDGYGRELEPAERRALRAWVILDSVSALAWGIPNTDGETVQQPATSSEIRDSSTSTSVSTSTSTSDRCAEPCAFGGGLQPS